MDAGSDRATGTMKWRIMAYSIYGLVMTAPYLYVAYTAYDTGLDEVGVVSVMAFMFNAVLFVAIVRCMERTRKK